MTRALAVWTVGILGAPAGAALAFAFRVFDSEEHYGETGVWLVLMLLVGAASVALVGALRLPPFVGAIAVLAGALAGAALATEPRRAPTPNTGWEQSVFLLGPAVLFLAVVLVAVVRQRDQNR